MSGSEKTPYGPFVIVQDRYGEGWFAIDDADSEKIEECQGIELVSRVDVMPFIIWGGDGENYSFKGDLPQWAALGATPQEALDALIAKRSK